MKPTTKKWRKKTPSAHRSYGQKRDRTEKKIQEEAEKELDEEKCL